MTEMITAERDQMLMMPPSIRDWLPEGHLAVFVADIVERLDLSALEAEYRGCGKRAFSPSLLLSLLFYGYATGTFSSRRIEQATYDSVAFRYLAGDTHPDHDTIATFRRRFIKELKKLFVQILLIAREMGCAKVGTVAIDGTKVHANASKHKAMSWQYALRLEKQLRKEIEQLMRKAEAADSAQTDREMDIPEEIRLRQQRLAKIEQAKQALEQRAAERAEQGRKLREERQRRREERQRRKGGKPGKTGGPEPKDQHNFTDGESRIMPSKGGFEQCYNAQAAVDVEDMLIVGTSLSNSTTDTQSLTTTLDAVTQNLETPGALLADSGFFSEQNLEGCESRGVLPYIALGRDKHNVPLAKRGRKRAPRGMSPARKEMWYRLHGELGRELYKVRKSTVEPVFGFIKHVMGFRQFLLRGLQKAGGEWDLVCLSFDIRRLHQMQTA